MCIRDRYNILVRPVDFLQKLYYRIRKPEVESLFIVTAADSSHFRSAMQLLCSVIEHEEITLATFYSLGLLPAEEELFKRTLPDVVFKRFEYEKYPEYLNVKINAGEYAWKPVIIGEVAKSINGYILWMDAGCVIEEPLIKVRNVLKKNGFYSPKASGLVCEWTHPGTIDYLQVDKTTLFRYNIAATVVGFDTRNKRAKAMLYEWKKLALVRECIAPEGSNRTNHRQDQTLLNILAYEYKLVNKSPTRLLGFKIHKDIG